MAVTPEAADTINKSHDEGRNICAIGVKQLCALETVAEPKEELKPLMVGQINSFFLLMILQALIQWLQISICHINLVDAYGLLLRLWSCDECIRCAFKEGCWFGVYGDAMLIDFDEFQDFKKTPLPAKWCFCFKQVQNGIPTSIFKIMFIISESSSLEVLTTCCPMHSDHIRLPGLPVKFRKHLQAILINRQFFFAVSFLSINSSVTVNFVGWFYFFMYLFQQSDHQMALCRHKVITFAFSVARWVLTDLPHQTFHHCLVFKICSQVCIGSLYVFLLR